MQRDRMQGHLQDRRSHSQSQSASASASDTPGSDSQQGLVTMTASVPSHSPKRSRSNQQADTGGYDGDAASHHRSSTSMRTARDQASQQAASQHQQQQHSLGNATTGSTYTSNTLDVHRRRQWSQTMLDVLQDLSLVLAPDGTIVWAPRTTKALLGFEPTRLVGERMADLIRPDEVAHFVHHFQESMDQQADFYHYYHVRKADGDYHCLEVSGRPHYEAVRDPETGGEMHATRCFFLHARPHPSRAAQALDTFFDIKVENEILRKKLRDMGVMEEDLSEMGLLGDSLLHQQQQQAQGQSSRGVAGQVGNGLDRSQGSLSGLSSSSHHRAQAAVSPAVEAILAQTQSWQQQQQQQQLQPSQSALGVPGRDSPAISDSFVNAFLSTEDLASEMAHRSTPPVVAAPPLGVLHATASYFYEPGHSLSPTLDQRSLLPMQDTRGALGPVGDVGNGASTVQDPRFLSYGGPGSQHIPPSQDFYPFGSPEPFSFGLYAQAGGGGGYGDEATQAYMSQPQQGHASQQQTPMTAPQTLPSHHGRAQQQQQQQRSQQHIQDMQQHQQRPGSASRSLASPTTHAARLLSGQGSSSASQSGSSSHAQQHYTDDTSTPVVQPAMLQPQATPTTSTRHAGDGGGGHAPGSAKHKKLKKTRLEGGPEHICTDCGTTDSPEWRRGPRGAKTLCNACGLRFAKLQKKAGTEQSAAHSAQQQQQQMEGGRGHARRASASTTGSGGGK